MKISSYYPVLGTSDVAGVRSFYERHFHFEARYTSDWYVHLAHRDHPAVALAIVAHDHPTVPASHRHQAQGLLLNFEVDDVDREWARLKAEGVELLLPIQDEDFGQRHFIVRGPDGVLIGVIQPIPPSAEFAAHYLPAPGGGS